MCGIVGYLGNRDAVPLIIDGLRRLEYRGYDSAGVAVLNGDSTLEVRRASGKLRNLEEVIRTQPVQGHYGIGHTRWATHGRPTEENAHPHRDCKGQIVVVHNGIVENYQALRKQLAAEGHVFKTETDTEVIAHLVEKYLDGNLEDAVRKAIKQISGVFAISVIASSDPNKIVAARSGPPVVIGLGENEFFVASDVPAILAHTRDMFFLDDGDVAILTEAGVQLTDFNGKTVRRQLSRILWDPIMAEKGGYKHFMLKEIFEQPRAIKDTMLGRLGMDSGRVFLDEIGLSDAELSKIRTDQNRRLRNKLARRFDRQVHHRTAGAPSRGSRLWQRIPLSRPHCSTEYSHRSNLAVGRNCRYAGCTPRGQAEGIEDARHLQCSRLHDYPRGIGQPADSRGPGNRCSFH